MKESSIRPKKLLKEYIDLCEKDALKFFKKKNTKISNCVACNSSNLAIDFVKYGFQYMKCLNCGSLFLNPRPPLEEFDGFYRKSESAKYWSDIFLPAVSEQRRNLIIKPKAKRIQNIIKKSKTEKFTIIDVGAGYGTFLEEFKKLFPNSNLIAIEPSLSLAERCKSKGIQVINSILEEVPDQFNEKGDIIVCFEVFEHVHNPLDFLKNMKSLCKKGGTLLITSLSIDGFDLQLLRQNSNQIHPPHHINFFSKKGFLNIFQNLNLKEIKLSTPGLLDVDIVRNYFSEKTNVRGLDPFLEKIVFDEVLSKKFQDFLKDNCLSSHIWIQGKK